VSHADSCRYFSICELGPVLLSELAIWRERNCACWPRRGAPGFAGYATDGNHELSGLAAGGTRVRIELATARSAGCRSQRGSSRSCVRAPGDIGARDVGAGQGRSVLPVNVMDDLEHSTFIFSCHLSIAATLSLPSAPAEASPVVGAPACALSASKRWLPARIGGSRHHLFGRWR